MECIQEVKINFSFQLQSSQVFKKEKIEKIIYVILMNHLETNNILAAEQSINHLFSILSCTGKTKDLEIVIK